MKIYESDQKEEFGFNLSNLHHRGWTPKLIKDLLPPPQLKPNPYNYGYAPMKLWAEGVVIEAEKNERFIKMQETYPLRQAAAEKGRQTRIANTLRELQECLDNVTVEIIPEGELRQLSIEHAKSRDYRGRYNFEDLSDALVERWMVNYLRHVKTEYHEILFRFTHKYWIPDVYPQIKTAILDVIAQTYPDLAEECQQQKNLGRFGPRH